MKASETRIQLSVCGIYIATNDSENASRKKSKSRFKPVFSGLKCPFTPRLLNTARLIRKKVNVESIKGAPKMAPTPISWLTLVVPVVEKIASRGTNVSGNAVPTAANNDPVTPSDMPSFSPRCSSALTKTSAATRINTR